MDNANVEAVEHARLYWAMCEDEEVRDLTKQLWEGLIHPLEYSDKMRYIANTRFQGIQ